MHMPGEKWKLLSMRTLGTKIKDLTVGPVQFWPPH